MTVIDKDEVYSSSWTGREKETIRGLWGKEADNWFGKLRKENKTMIGAQASTGTALGSGEVEGRYESKPAEEVMVLEKPVETPPIERPQPSKFSKVSNVNLKEYAELAAELGIECHSLEIQKFKEFLYSI